MSPPTMRHPMAIPATAPPFKPLGFGPGIGLEVETEVGLSEIVCESEGVAVFMRLVLGSGSVPGGDVIVAGVPVGFDGVETIGITLEVPSMRIEKFNPSGETS